VSGGPPPALVGVLAAILALVATVLLVGTVTFVSRRLGLSAAGAIAALGASLLGSWINIPLARVVSVPPPQIREIRVFGVRYLVVPISPPHETIIAVNVGGAVLPTALSLYVLVSAGSWGPALAAVAIVTAVAFLAARPVPGVGIVLPTLLTPVVAAVCAVTLAPSHSAAVAYAAGTLGTLIGADLLHLRHVERLGAPVASIGGAGTFDGIFVSGIVAVLLAAL
jgi:uncharacterized membrane protein